MRQMEAWRSPARLRTIRGYGPHPHVDRLLGERHVLCCLIRRIGTLLWREPMKLEVESRHVGMTPRWKQEIEERMAALQRGHDDLVHGRVTLTKNPHHKKAANVAEALVVVSLPGRHTITARKENKTFEEAI